MLSNNAAYTKLKETRDELVSLTCQKDSSEYLQCAMLLEFLLRGIENNGISIKNEKVVISLDHLLRMAEMIGDIVKNIESYLLEIQNRTGLGYKLKD